MLIAQTFCNIHFIYVWNCKNSRCYKKLQLLLDQSRLAVLLILFFFGQKKSFLWQIWQKRLLWLKSILCNHNSVITLLSTHEIIHVHNLAAWQLGNFQFWHFSILVTFISSISFHLISLYQFHFIKIYQIKKKIENVPTSHNINNIKTSTTNTSCMDLAIKKISTWPTQKKTEIFKTCNSQYFFQKFHGLVLGLVGLNDAKSIDVAQPIWPWGCLT